MGGDQRRSERVASRWAVDLVVGGRVERVHTVNLSRHGILVESRVMPEERYLVRVSVLLPDGPLEATAFVSRVDPDKRWVALQFFALSGENKGRWDAFVGSLARDDRYNVGAKGDVSVSSFLLRFSDLARLQAFLDNQLNTGQVYLSTPVLYRVGSSLDLVLLHPMTDEEFAIRTRVAAVSTASPKGMHVTFPPIRDALASEFAEFIRSGRRPQACPAPADAPAPAPPAPERPIPAEDDGGAAVSMDWADIDPSLIVDLSLEAKATADLPLGALPASSRGDPAAISEGGEADASQGQYLKWCGL